MTASLGFDKPLYILSFDDRHLVPAHSESDDMLTEEHGAAIASARAQVALAKHVAYDGFKDALAAGVPEDGAGIVVDEEFGADILSSAVARGYVTACPAEKSGQAEFDFEYGEDFAKHIETFRPTFCKVRVHYNPLGDQDLNRRQAARLKRLSDYLHGESSSLFLFELLVPADKDAEIRPRLTVEAIQQLQAAQVEPDVWRIEGLHRHEDFEKVVVAVRGGGRDKVGCIILCDDKDPEKVRESLRTAAGVQGFIGFAVGRSILSDPLHRWAARETTAKGAAAAIGRHYKEFVNIFKKP
jgi:myo-inositol catabolism protein IolC